jgi:hypothetical protein
MARPSRVLGSIPLIVSSISRTGRRARRSRAEISFESAGPARVMTVDLVIRLVAFEDNLGRIDDDRRWSPVSMKGV